MNVILPVVLGICAAFGGLPTWTFDEALEPWSAAPNVEQVEVVDGVVHGRIERGTEFIRAAFEPFEATPYQYVTIRMRASRPGEGNFLWAGGDEPAISWRKRMPVPVQGGDWETITILPFWQAEETISYLRFDLYDGADFEIDFIAVHAWADSDTPGLEDYTWQVDGALDSWQVGPNSAYIMAPPLHWRLEDRRIATIRLESDVDCEAALITAAEPVQTMMYDPFTIRQGDGLQTYNVELKGVWLGRAGHSWRDPFVALGLEIPIEAQPHVRIESITIQEEPQGPPHVACPYLGFHEAINRAETPTSIAADLVNHGGASLHQGAFRLELEDGLALHDSEATQSITLEPFDLPKRVTWSVVAEAPGHYEVRLVEAASERLLGAATLRFLDSVDAEPADYVPEPQPVTTDTDVFAYYFPGWDADRFWDCIRWYAPERKPWLGYYDEDNVELVDWQIKAAVENGITGFVIDWYWQDGGVRLNHWVEAYDVARYRDYLDVFLMYCNHVGEQSIDELVAMTEHMIERYFHWPTYYRIDNKPVVAIWDSNRLRHELGGSEAKREALAKCEALAQDAGYEGIYWIESGMAMVPSASRYETLQQDGYDAHMLYHDYQDARMQAPSSDTVDMADMVDLAEETWATKRSLMDDLLYFPVVSSGWDAHPWHGPHPTGLAIINRTPALFEELLRKAREDQAEHGQPFVLIGPINEWGEGSYIEPNIEYDFDLLEAVRNVFAEGEPADWPVNIGPRDAGLGPYEFAPLPQRAHWTFKEDAGGWEPFMGISDWDVTDGALHMRTTTNDPAMTVWTELDTTQYATLTVRMRVEGTLREDDFAIVFWGTRRDEYRGTASVLVPLEHDGEVHEYVFDLAANPHWQGTTRTLRFDPCASEGIQVTIEEMLLR